MSNVQKLGRFLCNIPNPNKPNASLHFFYSVKAIDDGVESMKAEWQEYLEWVNKNIIGPPQATAFCTEEQLQAQGMVGIYAPTTEVTF